MVGADSIVIKKSVVPVLGIAIITTVIITGDSNSNRPTEQVSQQPKELTADCLVRSMKSSLKAKLQYSFLKNTAFIFILLISTVIQLTEVDHSGKRVFKHYSTLCLVISLLQ